MLTLTKKAGETEISVTVKDNGGTSNGGVDTYVMKFKLTVIVKQTVVGELIATGVAEMEDNLNVRIYPNPSNDWMYIRINNTGFKEVDLSVQSITGQVVLRKYYSEAGNISFRMNGQAKGLYLVKLNIDSMQIVRKLIIN